MAGCGLWVVVAAGGGCVQHPDLQGPLPLRNQHPAQLTVMHLNPADARVQPAGQTRLRADAAYTSLFLFGATPGSSWYMDGEILRASLGASVGLGGGFQLGAHLPFAHTSGGFLDDFIIDYHDALGLPDQDRSGSPRDQFLVEAAQGGQRVWGMDESSAELLDVPLELTWLVRAPGEEQVGFALRTGLELPTGDQDRGYGNGEVDVAVGGVLDYRQGGVGYSLNAQHTFAGTPRGARALGFEFQDVTSAALSVELPLSETVHALIQTEWESSTLRDLGPKVAEHEQMLLWVGARWSPTPAWSFEFAFGEDLLEKASPDFTAWLGAAWRPMGGRRRSGAF